MEEIYLCVSLGFGRVTIGNLGSTSYVHEKSDENLQQSGPSTLCDVRKSTTTNAIHLRRSSIGSFLFILPSFFFLHRPKVEGGWGR